MKQDSSLRPYRFQLLAFTLTRLVINTGFRMVYPFLPVFARALGVDLQAIALAITARSVVGLTGPVVGSIGDRLGRKPAMLLGLGIFVSGMAVLVFRPTYPSLVLALLLGATGKVIFDPSMQAYLGDRVAYQQRSRSIAITEFGWSGAALLGLPIVGFVIARFGWVTPFALLAVSAAIAAFVLWRMLPKDEPNAQLHRSLITALGEIRAAPAALATLLIVLLFSAGNESVTLVFGAWLEMSFGLRVAALGAASAVIGLSELIGEGLVASITDRLGKRRSIGAGLILSAIACWMLPALSQELGGALLGLFLFFLAFEFTFVTIIALMTELVPTARATLLATNLAAAAGGRALGSIIGPFLLTDGILINALFASLLAIISFIILITFVRRNPQPEPSRHE